MRPLQPKYWCKHCKTFVKDTKLEKTNHEASAKHQGNLKRFLRDLHRSNEREEREKQQARDEVARLNGGPIASSARPPAGNSSNQPRVSSAATRPSSKATPEERKRQMAQLAEMGIAIPDEYRREMAMAGEWQTISTRPVYDAPDVVGRDGDKVKEEESPEGPKSGEPKVRVGKRRHEDDAEEGETAGRRKPWGSSTKTYPGRIDIDDDLDTLLTSTRPVVARHIPDAPAEKDTDSVPDGVKEESFRDPSPTSREGETPKPSSGITPNDSEDSKAVITEEIEETEEAVAMFKRRKQKVFKLS
jgi:hypothetical protein